MNRLGIFAVILCLFAAGGSVHSQMVCYRCNDCSFYPLEAVVCGGSGSWGDTGPTLPTSPAPTPSTTTPPPWYTTYGPTIATIPPWPRSAWAYGYLCYRVERYIPSQGRYVLDRGCALQLATYETTCNSVTGNQGYRNCQFCTGQLCNL